MKHVILFLGNILGICPVIYLVWNILHNVYGAEPSKAILHFMGDWSIYFLLSILLAQWCFKSLKISWKYLPLIIKIFGLYAFLYALGHILFYGIMEQDSNIETILREIRLRIYLFIGAFGFLILLILAIFSLFAHHIFTRISSLVYLAGLLSAIHYLLGQKIAIPSSYIIFLLFFILLCAKLLSKNKDSR
ncbi:hypothetical protein [Helicobacter sp. 11S03491-1]|uniref:hypothetical protein n=1 Tax=Helicobacter sp. 11S03491-1 TaxID=1476196 RepID=UPI000BA6A9BC|nr:hypothetical protein [Helicobacter sp. 11S03491-1]PAF42589.1 hypothetical protein BKH45_03485 [Helicobacter sp. 11S03491-1]